MTGPVNFCPGCGTKRGEGAVFCSECGVSLEGKSSSAEVASTVAADYPGTQGGLPLQSSVQTPPAAIRQSGSGGSISIPNPQRTVARIWFFLGLMSIALTQLPRAVEMDMMNGGYALIFFAGFFAFISFLTTLIYGGRAKEFDKISQGGQVLVHWHYSPREWQQFAGEEHKRNMKEKIGILSMITVIAIPVGIFFIFLTSMKGDDIGIALLVIFGLMFILAAAAFFSIIVPYLQNKTSGADAYILPSSVYVNRNFHAWGQLSACLETVTLTEAPHPLLNFTYSYISNTGKSFASVRIPVPDGKLDEARSILSYFQTAISAGASAR